jgi:hypothetical protein
MTQSSREGGSDSPQRIFKLLGAHKLMVRNRFRQPGGSVRLQPYLLYQPARLHRRTDSISYNPFLGLQSLRIRDLASFQMVDDDISGWTPVLLVSHATMLPPQD